MRGPRMLQKISESGQYAPAYEAETLRGILTAKQKERKANNTFVEWRNKLYFLIYYFDFRCRPISFYQQTLHEKIVTWQKTF